TWTWKVRWNFPFSITTVWVPASSPVSSKEPSGPVVAWAKSAPRSTHSPHCPVWAAAVEPRGTYTRAPATGRDAFGNQTTPLRPRTPAVPQRPALPVGLGESDAPGAVLVPPSRAVPEVAAGLGLQ